MHPSAIMRQAHRTSTEASAGTAGIGQTEMTSLRDIFDRPFAGPEMRKKYELALGRFLVAFNAVEDHMRFTAAEICRSLGVPELWKDHLVKDDFSRQLKNLRLLVLASPYFKDIRFDDLMALNAERNKLAHGHYEQDLFTDEFEIVGKTQRIKRTIDEIERATADAEVLLHMMSTDLYHFLVPDPSNE